MQPIKSYCRCKSGAKKMNISISIYHDCRRSLITGLYPVKIRVHSSIGHKTKYYQPFKNKLTMSKADFQLMMFNNRVKGDLKLLKTRLEVVVARFNESASRLSVFNFKSLEKELKIDYGKSPEIFTVFNDLIGSLRQKNKIGNMNNYISSRNSFISYLRNDKNSSSGKEIKLFFNDVTPEWLYSYEYWLTIVMGNSLTSVSIYTRTLRAIFNYARELRIITDDLYPFGKGKYVIPQVKKVKKALTLLELEKLIQAKPANKYEEKSRDLFLLLYYLQGINICDFINLKKRDYKDGIITYYRIKNKTRTKRNQIPTVVYVQPQAKVLIEKYQYNKGNRPDDYLIDHLEESDSISKKYSSKQSLTKYINDHIKGLAIRIGINPDISTNFARHTFATQIIENGGGIELAKELLSHSSIRVTEGYFAGFVDSIKSNFIKNMFNRSTNES